MSRRKRKLITTKDVAKILRVNTELVTYLRQYEKLPFVRDSKYILFSEPEVIRWRNKKLVENSQAVLNLKDYFNDIQLFKFTTYEYFQEKVSEAVMLDGDSVIKYIDRYNPEKAIIDVVGDIVHSYWDELSPKCLVCGRNIISSLSADLCSVCKAKKIDPTAFTIDDN